MGQEEEEEEEKGKGKAVGPFDKASRVGGGDPFYLAVSVVS